jgi:hypothetical protein
MKRKNSKPVKIAKKSNLLTGVVMYIIFISVLAAYAIQNLNTVWSKANDGLNQPTTRDFLIILSIWCGIYTTRGAVLILPKIISNWKKGLRGDGWIYGGIIASIPAEAYLVYGLLNLGFKQVCEANGDFDCGWDGLGLLFILLLSCGLQVAGMLLGSVIYFGTKHPRSKK